MNSLSLLLITVLYVVQSILIAVRGINYYTCRCHCSLRVTLCRGSRGLWSPVDDHDDGGAAPRRRVTDFRHSMRRFGVEGIQFPQPPRPPPMASERWEFTVDVRHVDVIHSDVIADLSVLSVCPPPPPPNWIAYVVNLCPAARRRPQATDAKQTRSCQRNHGTMNKHRRLADDAGELATLYKDDSKSRPSCCNSNTTSHLYLSVPNVIFENEFSSFLFTGSPSWPQS